jgi:predicted  nucleic acid-binding Zn-ribbon protein
MEFVHANLQEKVRLLTADKANVGKDAQEYRAEAEATCAGLKGEVWMLVEAKSELEKVVHQRDVNALDNCVHIDSLHNELQVAKGVCAQLQDEVQTLTTSNAELVDKAKLEAMKLKRKNEQLRL